MADTKISELDAAGAITGTELIPIVQDGETVRTTVSAIAGSSGLVLPTYVDLFGPLGGGGLTMADGVAFVWDHPNYTFLTGVTASTKFFQFSRGFPTIAQAYWFAVVTSPDESLEFQLCHMDAGPANITQIAAFANDGSNLPYPPFADVTTGLNALVTGEVDKVIGFRMRNTTNTSFKLQAVWLEINWQL